MTADEQASSSDAAKLEQLRNHLGKSGASSGELLGAGYQATVELVRTPFGDFVIKRARGPLLWRKLGERTLRRERDIHAQLRNVPGTPHCIGMLDEKHLVSEYIPGDSYRRRQFELSDRDQFFDRLLRTLDAMHAAGVAHGDLKRKDNLLVGPDERPYVIDFGLACVERESSGRFEQALFKWAKQYDHNAWIKHKYQRRVGEISPEDRCYYRPMKLELLARGIRIVWQALTLRRLRTRNRVR